ncbi:O-antigen ligase family protein [Clostridium oryzae]|uniref:O-antigen ligase family protein n=1 Tax=Clostridium oryzae TaxID=1450648 RepID=UPI0014742D89|nr:O-antigen ligase family protein [Clostridium oryzae]
MIKILKLIVLFSLAAIEYSLEIHGVSTYITEFAAAALALCTLFSLLQNGWKRQQIPVLICAAWLIYGIGMLIVLTVHNTENPAEIIKYMIILAIAAAIFFSFYVDDNFRPMWKTYCNVLIALGVIVVLVGIGETYFNTEFPKRFNSIIWGKSNRMTSRFLLLIPLTYFRAKSENEFYYIPFYLLITGIVMTVSRAGIIVLFVFFAFNARSLLSKRNILKTFIGFLFVFTVNYAVGIIPSIIYRCQVLIGQVNFRITENLNGIASGIAGDNVQSSISRLTLWKTALRDFTNNIVFGIGVDKYRTYYMSSRGRVHEINAHNWILQVLAETGVIGFIATVFFIVCIFTAYRKVYKALVNNGNKAAACAVLGGAWSLILFLLHNLMEASANSLMFGFGGVSVFIVIIMAITLGIKQDSDY